ncbi:MAG TPA: DNA helicase RecQ [Phycisphaerales bacterium]|nr:DNA helicase RecQ [Phycisphaerales bacterium]
MDGLAERAQHTIEEVAERVWGFHSLRPLQRAAIHAVLDGDDSLVVMPTGGGKSLCYQLPPMITGKLSLVISPLIALMQDQINGLLLNGYPAAAIHSGCSDDEVADAFRQLDSGHLRLLIVSPERATTGSFLSRLGNIEIGAIAIDEAHCISHWGHDFRPDYRRLCDVRRRFPRASLHAYTATATPRVRRDIIKQLGLREPKELVGTFDRPNLTYRVVPRVQPADQIAQILSSSPGEAGIVYCLSRKETEQIAGALMKRGINAAAYHAGLASEQRRTIEKRFSTERLDVVVATVAFGMGIDRSDVRRVIHASLPKSIEAYQQETGRAGRDGLGAECTLLYSSGDIARWRRLFQRSADDVGNEIESAQIEHLEAVRRFATGSRCRHRALSEHFGQDYTIENCGACDVCLGEISQTPDATVVSQKILSCVARVAEDRGAAYGSAYIAEVLRGSRSKKVLERGHDRLSTFGLLRSMRKDLIVSLIDQLVDQALLQRSEGEYPVLLLTPGSIEVMRSQREVVLLSPPISSATRRLDPEEPMSDAERVVFDRLRGLRRELASEQGVPPYVVFSDATLRDMVRLRPTTAGEMLEVKGVGQTKLQRFGDVFLEALHAESSAAGYPDPS